LLRAFAVAKSVGQKGDHASRVAGSVLVGGHAQASDRSQEILGINIGADLAGGRRGFHECSQGRFEPLPEVITQALVGGIAGVQRRR
jgi:hypothetical protein